MDSDQAKLIISNIREDVNLLLYNNFPLSLKEMQNIDTFFRGLNDEL